MGLAVLYVDKEAMRQLVERYAAEQGDEALFAHDVVQRVLELPETVQVAYGPYEDDNSLSLPHRTRYALFLSSPEFPPNEPAETKLPEVLMWRYTYADGRDVLQALELKQWRGEGEQRAWQTIKRLDVTAIKATASPF